MENSALNASHRYARQANKFFQSCKFDKAIEAHKNAKLKIDQVSIRTHTEMAPNNGRLYFQAMATSTVPRVLESLRLQKQFHSKQIDFVIMQREQYAQIDVDKGATFRKNLDSARDVSQELIKSLGNADKVIEVLEQKISSTRESNELMSKLFEDLKMLNYQSMVLCNRLVSQLHERIGENEDLRAILEENPTKGSQLSAKPRIPAAEQGGTSQRPTLIDSDDNELEELAPLELPQFDFNTFSALSTEEGSSAGQPPPPTTKDNETLRRIGFSSLEEENDDEIK